MTQTSCEASQPSAQSSSPFTKQGASECTDDTSPLSTPHGGAWQKESEGCSETTSTASGEALHCSQDSPTRFTTQGQENGTKCPEASPSKTWESTNSDNSTRQPSESSSTDSSPMPSEGIRSYSHCTISEVLPKSLVAECARLFASAMSIVFRDDFGKNPIHKVVGMLAKAERILDEHQHETTTYANQLRLIHQLKTKVEAKMKKANIEQF